VRLKDLLSSKVIISLTSTLRSGERTTNSRLTVPQCETFFQMLAASNDEEVFLDCARSQGVDKPDIGMDVVMFRLYGDVPDYVMQQVRYNVLEA
jgi:hypothetical protein